MRLSNRISEIQESQTVALSGLLAKMKSEGKDIVALGAGEPDFETPSHIKEAAIAAIQEGFTKYTPVDGTNELKEAICDRMKNEYDVQYQPSEIVVTCGAKHAVYEAICAVCNPGDEVILPVPYWVSYPQQIRLAGAVVRPIMTTEENHLKMSPTQLENAITDKTKLVILNSPNNPSGAVYSYAELSTLVNILKEKNIFILADEIYDKILFDSDPYTSMLCFPEIRSQLLYINGVSKSYAMTGWRIGFLAASPDVVAVVKKYQGHCTSNPASISQKAALAAYRGPQEIITKMNKAFSERREYIMKRLNAIKGMQCHPPQGAFYVFPNVSSFMNKAHIKTSVDLSVYLLENYRVAVVPGIAFGMDSCIRLSFATSLSILEKALDRIECGLMSLR
jgi:aspartate aminotransferase